MMICQSARLPGNKIQSWCAIDGHPHGVQRLVHIEHPKKGAARGVLYTRSWVHAERCKYLIN